VREVTLNAYARQDLPFEKLVEALRPERGLSRSPIFQVMFVLQNVQTAPKEALEIPGLTLRPLEVDLATTKFDLTLVITETEQGLSGTFEYSTDLFDASTIARMVRHFQTLLAGIAADANRPILDLAL